MHGDAVTKTVKSLYLEDDGSGVVIKEVQGTIVRT